MSCQAPKQITHPVTAATSQAFGCKVLPFPTTMTEALAAATSAASRLKSSALSTMGAVPTQSGSPGPASPMICTPPKGHSMRASSTRSTSSASLGWLARYPLLATFTSASSVACRSSKATVLASTSLRPTNASPVAEAVESSTQLLLTACGTAL